MVKIKRRKTMKGLIALVVVLVGLWVSVSSVLNLWKTQKQLSDLQGEVMALRDEDKKLRESEQYKESSLYIEKEARDKLNLIKPGEKIIDISGDMEVAKNSLKEKESKTQLSARELWVLLLSGGLN